MNFPTVTTVINPWNDFSGIPQAILDAAADRGTKVHKACELIAKGIMPSWEELSNEGILGYVESFERWMEFIVDDFILVEARLVCDLGFSGQIDFLVRSKHGENLLVDLKTPVALKKTWRPQLGAYQYLCEENGYKIDRCGSLRPSPDGKIPKMDYYNKNGEDMAGFMAALAAYRYFKGE